jgi:hypothetical protein
MIQFWLADSNASTLKQGKSNEFLIQHVTVRNFMCIEEFDAPVTTNVLAFQGLSEGKSASVVALLIGLGYDVLLENYVPTSLCGVSLKGEEHCQCSVLIYLSGVRISIGIIK